MDLKLTNFVDITIKNHSVSHGFGTYDTAALLYFVEGATATLTPAYYLLEEAISATDANLGDIATYINSFFNNGGSKLYVIKSDFGAYANSQTSGGTYTPTEAAVNAELEKLPSNYIMVGVTAKTAATNCDTLFRTIFSAWNTAHENEKIYQKIFVCEIPYVNGTTSDLSAYINEGVKVVSIENYVLKYGKLGVGAAVLAYYTKLNVYKSNAAQDYAFTTEVFDESIAGYVFKENSIVTEAILLDMNIVSKLASQIKNLGGNDTAGYDLTNQFMLLVLHQALTDSLVALLASKIKYNATGSALVLNTISAQLNSFVSNGYLNPGKVWTDPDLYYEGYRIVGTNEVLNTGYKVCMLPFSTLTPAEKAARQLPKVFVLIADSYSIRKIVISGEVF